MLGLGLWSWLALATLSFGPLWPVSLSATSLPFCVFFCVKFIHQMHQHIHRALHLRSLFFLSRVPFPLSSIASSVFLHLPLLRHFSPLVTSQLHKKYPRRICLCTRMTSKLLLDTFGPRERQFRWSGCWVAGKVSSDCSLQSPLVIYDQQELAPSYKDVYLTIQVSFLCLRVINCGLTECEEWRS